MVQFTVRVRASTISKNRSDNITRVIEELEFERLERRVDRGESRFSKFVPERKCPGVSNAGATETPGIDFRVNPEKAAAAVGPNGTRRALLQRDRNRVGGQIVV